MEDLHNSEFKEELETAIEAAKSAGEIIDSYARNGFDDWKKDDGSAITEADLKSQNVIVEKISQKFPEDGFLGEEENLSPNGEERVWVIDPIDGTFNFKKNIGYYCVSIALQVDNETKIGIVYSPETALGKVFFGLENLGAYEMNSGQKLEDANSLDVSKHESIEESVFLATILEVYEGEYEKEERVIRELSKKGTTHRQLGAAALELCYIASGKAEMLMIPILKEWDYAAGKIIVEEAGGNIRIRKSCFEDSYEVLASNGKLQEELEQIVGDRFQE